MEMAYKEAKRYLENLVGDRSMGYVYTPIKTDVLIEAIEALEEVEKHKETFEWCTDCKEYDQKEHCCHRWTKRIRDTLDEQKQATSDKASDKYSWYHPSENLPKTICPLIIDCTEGIGEGYYMGKGVFRFMRFGINVSDDDVYRWTFMPQHDEDVFR